MNTFIVTKKSDNSIVFKFDSDAKVVWDQFPESEYDYTTMPYSGEIPVLNSVFHGRRELTHLEFRSLFTQEEIEDIDEFQASFELNSSFDRVTKKRIRTAFITYSTASFVNLDDHSTALGLGVYAAIGLLAPNRIAEVLNG